MTFTTGTETHVRHVGRYGATLSAAHAEAAGVRAAGSARAFWHAALELDPDAPDEGRTMRYCSPSELAS